MPIRRLALAIGNDINRCPLFASPVPNAGKNKNRAPSLNLYDSYIPESELLENISRHGRVALRGTTRPQSAAIRDEG
jgi:hypothetical protein